MREIDRRTEVRRRVFLKGSATAIPAAALAAAGAGVGPKAAWGQNAKALSPHAMTTLVQMARDIYPHDFLADAYYIVAVSGWDSKAASDAVFKTSLEAGVARLDGDAHDRFGTDYILIEDESDRVALLHGIEETSFFRTARADLVVSLYNQHDLWKKFGYEGSSWQDGGYIHRGFNDINWVAKS